MLSREVSDSYVCSSDLYSVWWCRCCLSRADCSWDDLWTWEGSPVHEWESQGIVQGCINTGV